MVMITGRQSLSAHTHNRTYRPYLVYHLNRPHVGITCQSSAEGLRVSRDTHRSDTMYNNYHIL
jgi:hypothetical protein